MELEDAITPRGPGSLVHRHDGDGWGPSGCTKCGWRGVPSFNRAGEPSNVCPACEQGPASDAEYAELEQKQAWGKVGRNDPCPCGSGKKAKKCHFR